MPESGAFLVSQLDMARELGRRRRLRSQLPLGIAGLLIANVSVIAAYANQAAITAGLGMALGPSLLLLCALPTGTLEVGVTISCAASTCCIAMFWHLIGVALTEVRGCGPPAHTQRACVVFRMVNAYAIGVASVHALYACFLGLALYGSMTRSSWLPSRPPRASLDATWRFVGSNMIW
jgi:uncharacterized membrane protein (UPF0136 family)